MSDFETWKMLWQNNLWNPKGRKDVIDAVCEQGDAEALKWFWEGTSWNPEYRAKIQKALLRTNEVRDKSTTRQRTRVRVRNSYKYHAFICHASEDKSDFVTPLANALIRRGVKVWYDKFALKLGDSLRQKIDEGLRDSRYGIVVLSQAFFKKNWPKLELDGLISKEVDGEKVILPIWYGVSRDDVVQYSLILSGRVASLSSKGLNAVVNDILDVIFE